MARVIVDVMPKPEILDPQGKAVHGALPRLGFDGITRRPAGQAVRARGRRGRRGHPRRGARDRRDAAVQPGHRGLRRPRRGGRPNEDRGRHLPRFPRRHRRRSAPSGWPAASRSRCGTATTTSSGVDAVILPGGFSYGDYLRCGAIARFAPVMTEVVEAAQRRHAGARHLQRLPDPLRVAPAARRADPQRPPHVHLPRPGAPGRERRHRVDVRVPEPARRSSSR